MISFEGNAGLEGHADETFHLEVFPDNHSDDVPGVQPQPFRYEKVQIATLRPRLRDGQIVTQLTGFLGCTDATTQELIGDKAFGTALTLAFANESGGTAVLPSATGACVGLCVLAVAAMQQA